MKKNSILIECLLVVFVLAFMAAPAPLEASNGLPSDYATIKDWDKAHEAFSYSLGGTTASGGDFFIADREANSIIHVFESPGVIDMGAIPLNAVTEAPASGYQGEVKPISGHSYVTRSQGKYGKFYIHDIMLAGEYAHITVTQYEIEWSYQPNGTRTFGGGATPTPTPAPTPVPTPSGTLFEYYNSGDDGHNTIRLDYWMAQTFTAISDHSITSVRLKLFREGNPGTVTVSIRVTDMSGHPSGSDLGLGTIAGSYLATNTNGEWYQITLSNPCSVTTGKKYAIVVRQPSIGAGNNACWRGDYSSAGYAGGNMEQSADGGTTWVAAYSGQADYMFEVWVSASGGTPPPPPSGCNWTGTWDHYDVPGLGGKYLDTLYFQQVGNQVTVTYKVHTYRRIMGTVSGNTLTGTWGDSPPYNQGIVEITISADCNSITGRWRWPSSAGWEGTWVGTRQGTIPPLTIGSKLVLHLPFDGNYNDLSGFGNNGTPKGNMRFANGAIGQGAQFDGGSFVEIPDSNSLDLSTALTFAVWLYKEDAGVGGWAVVLSKGDTNELNNNSPYALLHDGGGVYPVVRFAKNNSCTHVTSSTKTNFKEWYHLAATWDGKNVKFYINGALGDTKTWEGALPNSPRKLLIGYDSPGAPEYFKGIMDDLRIYNYVLSGSEIKSLYNMRSGPPPPPPTGLALVAESRTVPPGTTVQVPVLLQNAQNIGSMNFNLTYDPRVLRVTKVDRGSLLSGIMFAPNYQQPPVIRFGFAAPNGVSGSGSLAYIEFQAIGADGNTSPLTISEVLCKDTSGQTVSPSTQNGTVTIGKKTQPGDYNGDGKVTEVDALAALKMSVKLLTEDLILDMDKDGKITAEDARLILKQAITGGWK